MIKAQYNPATPAKTITQIVEIAPEQPATVTLTMDMRMVTWLYIIAGLHNGGTQQNPLSGLYGALVDLVKDPSTEFTEMKEKAKQAIFKSRFTETIDVAQFVEV